MNLNKNIKETKNKKHIVKTYTDKATNLLNMCKKLFILSFITYLSGMFIYQSFDFGLIFEFISCIFVLLALRSLQQDNLNICKRNIILSMIPIGLLILYDFIILLANIFYVIHPFFAYYTRFRHYFYYISPYLVDGILITNLALLYTTLLSLNKADGTQKATNYTETFYDNL